MHCYSERSEESVSPFRQSSANRRRLWWFEQGDASSALGGLSMTEAKYGVEYGDRTVPMSEAARRAVQKLARRE